MDKTLLDISDIEINKGWNVDAVGFLFTKNGEIYRAISDSFKDDFEFLFYNNVVSELYEAGLVPQTTISDYSLEGYQIVLQHHKISVVTYAPEWTFSMLRDAAIVTLKVNLILSKYNFETIDAHSYNILFDNFQPKFIDFGSFRRRIQSKRSWSAIQEFTSHFLNPLRIWSNGNSFLARKVLTDAASNIDFWEYSLYKYPLLRIIPQNIGRKLVKLKYLISFPSDTIKNGKLRHLALQFIKQISVITGHPRKFENQINRLIRKTHSIRLPKFYTRWGGYHSEIANQDNFNKGSRFDLVLSILKKNGISSFIEIAGNQGILAFEAAKNIPGPVICSDYDEIAVEMMYKNGRSQNAMVTPMLLDFLHPIYQNSFIAEEISLFHRVKTEAVIALALSHHVLLAQHVPIDTMFQALKRYTSRYILIEFMPNGVDGKVPIEYGIEWFELHFCKYFELLERVTTTQDGSRILFFGELNNTGSK